MASKSPTTLSPELSKRARRELGLSQADVIKATGIQGYKLKQWEGRGLSIELSDIRLLTDFYEEQGVDFAELTDHINRSNAAARPAPPSRAAEATQPLQAGFTYAPRPGFMISDQLTPEVIDTLMERMEANDERVGELTAEAFTTGFLGISGDTEAKLRELLGTLAESHVIFRCLQGRNIVSPLRDEPKTIGDYLAKMMQSSPVLPLLTDDADGGAPSPNAAKPKPKVKAIASAADDEE
ncbi:hypothetical protein BH11PSE9_BH11PSE9_21100 [soil metagenome]